MIKQDFVKKIPEYISQRLVTTMRLAEYSSQKVKEAPERNDNEKRRNESHDQLHTLVLEVNFRVIT